MDRRRRVSSSESEFSSGLEAFAGLLQERGGCDQGLLAKPGPALAPLRWHGLGITGSLQGPVSHVGMPALAPPPLQARGGRDTAPFTTWHIAGAHKSLLIRRMKYPVAHLALDPGFFLESGL